MVLESTGGSPSDAAFKKGDVIGGEYTIHKLVGRGGFGEVFLAHFSDGKWLCALKTIRSDLLPDPASKEAFKKEALLWVNLEEHPFIVAARAVHEYSRRLFVNMDYITPDANGRVSLADHLACTNGPLDPDDSLKWAIQFCYGMEHSFQRGIKCHRDIKPTNILIAPGGNLKISDFGLALAAEMSWKQNTSSVVTENSEGGAGLSLLVTAGKRICGTPGYIAPELLLGAGADVRSDIYSFGLVLWQMAKGSQAPPFHVPFGKAANIDDYLQRVFEQQIKGRIPYAGGATQSVIERCLAPEPSQRYETFSELRLELAQALFRRTGCSVELPKGADRDSRYWTVKGMSLNNLGRHQDAIVCIDKAIELDQHDAYAWSAKGNALVALGRLEEAMTCYDEALRIHPKFAAIWNNKGIVLHKLRRYQEALTFYASALEIDTQDPIFWSNKGKILCVLGRYEEALACCNQILEIDPSLTGAWGHKGQLLGLLGRYGEAIESSTRGLELNPQDVMCWQNTGLALDALGRHDEAIICYTKALEIDPRDHYFWVHKGKALAEVSRFDEAFECFDKALEIEPDHTAALESRRRCFDILRSTSERTDGKTGPRMA